MNIVITSGGTSEKIDNVRKITNSSSGKLGCIIAKEILNSIKNANIYYICSRKALKPKNKEINIIEIDSVSNLKDIVTNLLSNDDIDYFIHAMAVSDYTVDYVTNLNELKNSIINYNNLENIKKYSDSKISSTENYLVIVLKKTPKIISIIKNISPNTHLIGFKLLDSVSEEKLIMVAKNLKEKNKCDLVVANDLSNIKNNIHKAYLIGDNIERANSKEEIAKKLVRRIKYGF